MGLLKQTQRDYYASSDLGGYQFISLKHIINNFMISYVGEGKIIPKIKRTDVLFHAQRAIQELSYDTLKSIKSQEIELPPSLTMPLPHDYVNYVKLAWSDSAGIEHIVYPTSKTSNPFKIRQASDKSYDFPPDIELVVNNDFSDPLGIPWIYNSLSTSEVNNGNSISVVSGALSFTSNTEAGYSVAAWGRSYAAWQEIDVSDLDYIDISATGSSAPSSGTIPNGTLRFGLSTTPGDTSTAPVSINFPSQNINPPNIAYLEWIDGTSSAKEENEIDVRSYGVIYVLITSHTDFVDTTAGASTNSIDDISVTNGYSSTKLNTSISGNSTTWSNYKSGTPSENQDDYQDDTYWPNLGGRRGLDPVHAQGNGSFFIDELQGKIHFSSNINGKNIILKYISDGLGTDEEMIVHKFAEEAMYKSIAYAILSTTISGQPLAPSFQQQKSVAIRTAKLRLSNLKIEELTQIMRGKSKFIKH